jgi:hypothetical protein
MEARMKKYALLLVSILLIVGIFGLPPKPSVRSWWLSTAHRTIERQTFLDSQNELILENWLFQRVQWRDSVVAVLEGVDPAVTPYTLAIPEWGPDSARAHLEEGVTRHLQQMGMPQPRVPVGVFFVPQDMSAHPRAPKNRYGSRWTQREIYVAREGEEPFCGLLEPVAVEGGYNGLKNTVNRLVFVPRDPISAPNTLRLCGYYARYGVPGQEIEDWLRNGGASLANGSNRYRRSDLIRMRGPLRYTFGRLGYNYNLTQVGYGCLAGIAPACLTAFHGETQPLLDWVLSNRGLGDKADISPVDFFTSRWWLRGHFGGYDEFLFESLEKEFGPERFQAFWASELPVLEAFQSAFGLPAEEWVMAWAQAFFGPLERGPGVPLNASLLALLTIGVFGGLAASAANRRG